MPPSWPQPLGKWLPSNETIVVLPAGASISATEDGRRLYVFGGNDGTKALNDVYFLDLEKLQWNLLTVHVSSQ